MPGPLTQIANTLSSVAGAATDSTFWGDVAKNAASLGRPDSTPTTPGLPSQEQLAHMPWAQLLALRKQPGLSQPDQNYIGPYEHRAYARENVQAPFDALQNSLLTLGYSPYKALIGSGRSQPSFAEISQGLLEGWEGMTK